MIGKQKKLAVVVLAIIVASVLTLALVVFLKFFVIYHPVEFQQTKFDDLVDWARTHDPPGAVVVRLPEEYRRLSITGYVYVTGEYLFVPTWIGRRTVLPNAYASDRGCEGYLFAGESIKYDVPAGDIDQVTINIPAFSGLYGADRPTGTVRLAMFVLSVPGHGWYYLDSGPNSVLDY